MTEKRVAVDFDILTLAKPVDRPDDSFSRNKDAKNEEDACKWCNSKKLLNTGNEIICLECKSVQEKIIEQKDRAMYDSKQVKERATQSPTSILSYDKSLGSRIGASKTTRDAAIQKLVMAERRFVNGNAEREMKEVIRLIMMFADAGCFGLSREEVEELVLNYRKKFLGTKLSIGRPRNVVMLAYMFLEMRTMSSRQYSIAEFLKIASNGDDADNLKRDFMSTVSHMQKEHGYKLLQPTVDAVVNNIAVKLGLPPKVTVDGYKIATLVQPYYKGKGIKSSGMAGAIIMLACKKHGIRVNRKELMGTIQDTRSSSTVQNRLGELRSILASALVKMGDKLATADDARKLYLKKEITFVNELLIDEQSTTTG